MENRTMKANAQLSTKSPLNHHSPSPKPVPVPDSEFPLFKLGQVFATPGATDLLRSLALSPLHFLSRHAMGDWGQVDDHDREANRAALHDGSRLLSSYKLSQGKLWIITEADRRSTTLLLPQEY